MVAADDDRRFELTLRYHLVEGEADAVPIAQADPADARGQALEADAFARHVEPIVQMRIVGQQLLHFRVGAIDVFRIARQRAPAERSDAAAKQRADIGRHEAWKIEGVRDAVFLRHLADIVPVIDRRHAHAVEGEHRAHMFRHRMFCCALHALGIAGAGALHCVSVQPFGRYPFRGSCADV